MRGSSTWTPLPSLSQRGQIFAAQLQHDRENPWSSFGHRQPWPCIPFV